jgi:RNA polymerase sigma factor (TIGR02999 family)
VSRIDRHSGASATDRNWTLTACLKSLSAAVTTPAPAWGRLQRSAGQRHVGDANQVDRYNRGMSAAASQASIEEVTHLLAQWQKGSDAALNRLLPIIYDALREMAGHRLRRDHAQPLDPTELVHESLLRMLGSSAMQARNRAHFMALAALNMRAVLVDLARAQSARKRGGDLEMITLTTRHSGGSGDAMALVTLDQALSSLQSQDPRAARVVEMNFFAGMERSEIAEVLNVSLATVDRDLRFARAWLNQHLERVP